MLLFMQLYVIASPAFLGAVFTTFFVRESLPNSPPSASAAEGSEAVGAGLRRVSIILKIT
jgi:hypothetical protein